MDGEFIWNSSQSCNFWYWLLYTFHRPFNARAIPIRRTMDIVGLEREMTFDWITLDPIPKHGSLARTRLDCGSVLYEEPKYSLLPMKSTLMKSTTISPTARDPADPCENPFTAHRIVNKVRPDVRTMAGNHHSLGLQHFCIHDTTVMCCTHSLTPANLRDS